MTRRTLFIALFSIAAVLLAACGDDGADSTAASDTSEHSEEGDEHADEGDEHAEEAAFGAAADPADADRTVEVTMTDELVFEPESIEVADGEIVTFVVTNEGSLAHDFTIGDAATQDAHDEEMAEMEVADETGSHDPNALTVIGGETGEITWQFEDPGEEILFGCHIPGHYSAGMVGDFVLA